MFNSWFTRFGWGAAGVLLVGPALAGPGENGAAAGLSGRAGELSVEGSEILDALLEGYAQETLKQILGAQIDAAKLSSENLPPVVASLLG